MNLLLVLLVKGEFFLYTVVTAMLGIKEFNRDIFCAKVFLPRMKKNAKHN